MYRFKLLFTFMGLFAIVTTYAQDTYCPPVNIGFEDGTFNHWQCDTGGIALNGVIDVIPSGQIFTRQTMIDSNYIPKLDKYGNFPTLCPYGGLYSIKLGNEQVGARAERVSYTFTVPIAATEYSLVFYYAVVLENPTHQPFQQPRFTVKTFDVTDSTYVNCTSFDFVASANLPGFKISMLKALDSVFYKDWSPTTINLQGYAGKQIRLEFTTNDCTLGGHFGYAYLDVDENCSSPITGNAYCTGQNGVSLLAPGGFDSYLWYTGDLSKLLVEGQALKISPAPPDQSKYAVVLIPHLDLGCPDTLYTTVSSINSGFTFAVKDTIYGCAHGSANLTAASVTAGSSPGLTLNYYADSLGTTYVYQPQSITTSGTYYIRAVSNEGCTNILPVQVEIGSPVVKVTDPEAVKYPATVDISTTFTHVPGVVYTYFADNKATVALPDYKQVPRTGTYYILATGKGGCTTIAPVNVLVNSPPPPIVNAVNTFTPNGDGINDYFGITITGYGEFNSLKIYNRQGQLVFQTTSIDILWDGKFKGSPLNVGTYYWVFDGTNTYDHTGVTKSGYITLIR
jgi:gliding motility-associated-like protein